MPKRVLIVDALNFYYRFWIANPTLSSHGYPAGGLAGFLTGLQKQLSLIKPDEVIICWDGEGGSGKKKTINKSYKDGRSPIRLNRSIRNLSDEEESKNKIHQQIVLMELLSYLPFRQIMLDGVEADDVIAFLCNEPKYDDWQKVILSNDKDFYQLCDDKTVIYRSVADKFMNRKSIIDEFGIHPNNFALARAIAGDVSDNLPGVPRVGLKTVSKRFEEFKNETALSTQELVSIAKEKSKNSTLSVYTNIAKHKDLILENYNLMQLESPLISPQSSRKIKASIHCDLVFNKTEALKVLFKEGISLDLSRLYVSCNGIIKNDQS